jgi:hypothetical protein
MRTLVILVFAVQVGAAVAEAQSLGEVARQEAARRKTVTSAGKVYTNDNLRPDGTTALPAVAPAPLDTPAPVPSDTPAAATESPASRPGGTADKGPEPKKTEAYWRDRITSERDALSRAELFAESLQSRINALTADFSARDDPFQRNRIGQDRQQALGELERVRKEIAGHTKAIADIQEEARKAGAPAGWVR